MGADSVANGWLALGDVYGHHVDLGKRRKSAERSNQALFWLGFLAAAIFFKGGMGGNRSFWSLAVFFTLVTASHRFFDAMTDGGLGIAFFAPFNNKLDRSDSRTHGRLRCFSILATRSMISEVDDPST